MNETYNVYLKIGWLRDEIRKKNIKMTGEAQRNKFFQLSDFMPHKIELEKEIGLVSLFNKNNEGASLQVINVNNPEDTYTFTIENAEINMKGMAEIQKLGGEQSYLRRYLHYNYLDLSLNDEVDNLNAGEIIEKGQKEKRYASKEQVDNILMLYKERVPAMLKHYKIETLNELDAGIAEGLIKRIELENKDQLKEELDNQPASISDVV